MRTVIHCILAICFLLTSAFAQKDALRPFTVDDNLNMVRIGDGEFIDQMTGVDHVIELGYVDHDKLGIRGGSWGDVSSGYTITQTDRFKAAFVACGVTNWAAEVGPGFSYDVGLWYIGGKPWTNREEWVKRSSITHVTNVKNTAVLVRA